MGIFNYIDTFFFISLGITFVLILLLVYHFKERISNLEEKNNTMFDIVNNIFHDISIMKQTISNKSYYDIPDNKHSSLHEISSNPLYTINVPFNHSKPECINDYTNFNTNILYQFKNDIHSVDSNDDDNNDEDNNDDDDNNDNNDNDDDDDNNDDDDNDDDDDNNDNNDDDNNDETSTTNHDETSATNHEETLDTNHHETSSTNHDETSATNHDETSATNHDETLDTNHHETTSTNHDETSATNDDETLDTNHDETSSTNHDETFDEITCIKTSTFNINDIIKLPPIDNMELKHTETKDDVLKGFITDYKKMNLSQLKSLVVLKGITVDTSKLKKNELIKLLE